MESSLLNLRVALETNPKYRFWVWHIGFWLFLCIVGFFTLILWYSEVTFANVAHIIMQAVLGLFFSILMQVAFERMHTLSVIRLIFYGLVLVLFTSLCWTLMHMQIFVMLTGYAAVWNEFGGWYFSSIFVFLCWTGLFYGIRYYELSESEHKIMLEAETKSRIEHLKRISAQSEAADAKLKMLRYQLNPHFLCNTLNAINSLIEIGESDKAQRVTVQLSEFLRYSLNSNPNLKTSLDEEVSALNLYLRIEETRFAERLRVNIDISDEAQEALVPSLLLQPIIENSMKHAVAKSVLGGEIDIKAHVEDEQLVIQLSDTGSDANSDMVCDQVPSVGVGLKNIRQRLNVLYEDNHSLTSAPNGDRGLMTTIVIPYERNQPVSKAQL
ncbi:histidine kinase [Glaciecola sp. XM2]|jgi:sensor histidine kinase YesM|uniref:sensor histidine kinase n=1 Tax=Glaciecola sp. XM2 TaxID=1914931 RepID=UPI001BDF2AE6|nr:histidine kinase [Glaciecola sp. XM2]MBT1451109.1 histidine kinase [Glaciecola sp. XM2]